MICPKCKAEYRDGFYVCSDCSIPLIVKLPETEELQAEICQEAEYYTGDFVDIAHTTNSSDYLTVKLALDDEGIPHNFSGDILFGCDDSGFARFFVPIEFKERALQVVTNLKLVSK